VTVASLWRLWALGIVAVFVAALLVADRLPSGGDPSLVRPAARMPVLPPVPALVDADGALDTLSRSTIWGLLAAPAADSAGAPAEAAPAWSLSGYYEAAGVRRVIVSVDNAAVLSQQLAVGERLPDGAVILAIEPDRVRVRRGRDATGAATGPRTAWLPIGPAPPVARR
jgi:hypothetical protein